MSQLTDVIIKAGLVPDNVLKQLARWGMPVNEDRKPDELHALPDLEQLVEAIDEAIQSEGYVLMRETDLEAIPQYLQTMKPGVLHVVIEDGTSSDFEVQYGIGKTGDVIMPWRSDSITDLLTNGETYLKVSGEKVFFSQARELFYGANKAFVVCTPSTREPDGHRH